MYNKPLTIAATTLLLCSPVMILTSCEGKKDSAGQMPALVPEVQVTKLVTRDVPTRQEWWAPCAVRKMLKSAPR